MLTKMWRILAPMLPLLSVWLPWQGVGVWDQILWTSAHTRIRIRSQPLQLCPKTESIQSKERKRNNSNSVWGGVCTATAICLARTYQIGKITSRGIGTLRHVTWIVSSCVKLHELSEYYSVSNANYRITCRGIKLTFYYLTPTTNLENRSKFAFTL